MEARGWLRLFRGGQSLRLPSRSGLSKACRLLAPFPGSTRAAMHMCPCPGHASLFSPGRCSCLAPSGLPSHLFIRGGIMSACVPKCLGQYLTHTGDSRRICGRKERRERGSKAEGRVRTPSREAGPCGRAPVQPVRMLRKGTALRRALRQGGLPCGNTDLRNFQDLGTLPFPPDHT